MILRNARIGRLLLINLNQRRACSQNIAVAVAFSAINAPAIHVFNAANVSSEKI